MSMRAKRQHLGASIAARLKEIQCRRDKDSAVEAALTEALAALAEMPRPSQPSEYVLEYIPIHPASVEQGHCGVCGESSIGWSGKWNFCPVCGNPITVKRETLEGQNTRTAVEAVREAIGA